jgi:hypothetical protein
VHHGRPTRNAEEQSAQQGAELVPAACAVVAFVALEGFMGSIPRVLIDDPLVLARIQGA